MELKEKTVSQEMVCRGIVVNIRHDKAQLLDGSIRDREVIEHPGGVAVFALDDEDRVILVRQFRYPMGTTLLELPAGKLEPGEEPAAAALRELEEETGMIPSEFVPLGFSCSSPGIFEEKIHLFLARGLRQGTPHPDDGEFLQILRMPYAQLLEKARQGEICDGKTLAGILKASLYLGRL